MKPVYNSLLDKSLLLEPLKSENPFIDLFFVLGEMTREEFLNPSRTYTFTAGVAWRLRNLVAMEVR
jgi:hypothetical protein